MPSSATDNNNELYTYFLKTDPNDLNMKHHKVPEIIKGTVNALSDINAMVKVIRTNKHVRMFLVFKYYTDCAILEEKFGDPDNKYGNSMKKFYAYCNENENMDDLSYEETIEYINSGKLKSDKFTKDDLKKIIQFYKNKLFYSGIINSFWNRSFDEDFEKINDANMKRLAELEIRDGDIQLSHTL